MCLYVLEFRRIKLEYPCTQVESQSNRLCTVVSVYAIHWHCLHKSKITGCENGEPITGQNIQHLSRIGLKQVERKCNKTGKVATAKFVIVRHAHESC